MADEILKPKVQSLLLRIVRFPLTKIVLALFFIVAGMLIVVPIDLFCKSALLTVIGKDATKSILIGAQLIGILCGYLIYVRLVEGRQAIELSPSRIHEVAFGTLIGTLLFSLIIAVLWAMDVYHVTGSNDWTLIFGALWIGITPGIVEELIFRGVLYRIIEESLGSWIALVISSLLFGFAHFFNPHSTWLSLLAIAVEAGLLLGMAFSLTRCLWFPIGIHFAWNFVQGGVFGVEVSGVKTSGWLISNMTGPEYLSGGEFGVEASCVAVVLCLGLFTIFWRTSQKRGHLVAPFWARSKNSAEIAEASPQAN